MILWRNSNFELDSNEYAVEFINLIKDKLKKINVTLLYAAKNETYYHENVLREWIKKLINDIRNQISFQQFKGDFSIISWKQ